MAAKYYIRSGFVETDGNTALSTKSKPLNAGRFDLHLWLKRELSSLGVASTDTCCTVDVTNLPIRYNLTATKLQYLAANGTWTNLSSF